MKLSTTISQLSLGLAVTLGLCLAPAAKADPILFDPDGAGGVNPAYNITGLGFGPGNALAINAITPGVGLVLGAQFTLDYQTHLTSLVGPGAPNFVPGLNQTFQITEVASFTEVVTGLTTAADGTVTATFSLVPSAANRMNIYFNNAVTFNDAAGTGFTDGTLIASLNPSRLISSQFTDTTSTNGLTQFNRTNAGNNSGSGQTTQGSGSTNLASNVLSTNPAFFITQPLLSSLLNSNLSSVFDAVPPSVRFTDILGGTTTTRTPNIGAINGRSGPDFQIQVSGFTQSFAVPEPASVAMTVIGLAGAGLGSFAARRRQAKASA